MVGEVNANVADTTKEPPSYSPTLKDPEGGTAFSLDLARAGSGNQPGATKRGSWIHLARADTGVVSDAASEVSGQPPPLRAVGMRPKYAANIYSRTV